MEMLNVGTLNHLHISFMVAGHTKFAPDRLLGSAFKVADTFTLDELRALCSSSSSAETYIENGDNIY